MKKISVLLFLLFNMFFCMSVSWAVDEENDIIQSQFDHVDVSKIQSYIEQIDQDVGQFIPNLNLLSILDDIRKGKVSISFQGLLVGLTKFFLHEIFVHSSLLAIIIILAVLYAVLENIYSAFEEGTLGKITFWVCGLALYALALSSFTLTMGIAKETIDKMVSFFNSLLPILITLIVGVGHITSAAILSPLTLAATAFFANLVNQVVLPLIYICTVLLILDHISDRFKVNHLAKLCRDTAIGIIGVSLTIYITVLNIQGAAGKVSDGVALETAKYATGTFIPLVGKFLSDSIEIIVGTSLLIKGAVSIVGVFLIALICIFPLLKILSLVVIYRAAAALIQPFGAKSIADTLNTIGNCLLLVFGAVASIGLMLFFGISILVKVGRPF